jgi:hypothetical protein
MPLRDDFLMRMIARIVELIGRAMGLAKQGKHDEAENAIDDAYKKELGMPRPMLDRLDPATVVSTLGGEKTVVVTALLDAEAQLAELAGDDARAAERRARAAAIRNAAGLPVPDRSRE